MEKEEEKEVEQASPFFACTNSSKNTIEVILIPHIVSVEINEKEKTLTLTLTTGKTIAATVPKGRSEKNYFNECLEKIAKYYNYHDYASTSEPASNKEDFLSDL